MSKKDKAPTRISFFNWFVTLIMSLIPGVNLLFFIITIGAAKTQVKRSYAVAALVLALILALLFVIALFFMSDVIIEWLNGILVTAEEIA